MPTSRTVISQDLCLPTRALFNRPSAQISRQCGSCGLRLLVWIAICYDFFWRRGMNMSIKRFSYGFCVVALLIVPRASTGQEPLINANTIQQIPPVAKAVLESVSELYQGLQSFRSMRRIDASFKNASALRLRFSQSFARRRQRLSHAIVRSTIQRLGNCTNPIA